MIPFTSSYYFFFFFQAEDGIRDHCVTGVQTCALPIYHVALSIVGTDRTPDNGYFRAKVAQEKLIETSRIPYTIIHSTQFRSEERRVGKECRSRWSTDH